MVDPSHRAHTARFSHYVFIGISTTHKKSLSLPHTQKHKHIQQLFCRYLHFAVLFLITREECTFCCTQKHTRALFDLQENGWNYRHTHTHTESNSQFLSHTNTQHFLSSYLTTRLFVTKLVTACYCSNEGTLRCTHTRTHAHSRTHRDTQNHTHRQKLTVSLTHQHSAFRQQLSHN